VRALLGSRSWQLVVLSGIIILVAAGTGYATIPSSGNVFSACVLKNVGSVRLIDPSLPARYFDSHCSVLENQVSWNQTGTPGPVGAPGAPGTPGTPGPVGPQGPASDDTRVVTAANLRGFELHPNGDNTPDFNGPDADGNGTVTFGPSNGGLGMKSINMKTLNGKSVAVFLPAAPGQRLLSEITSFAYSSKVIMRPAPAYDVTAQVEVFGANVGTASGYTTVVYEPANNSLSGATGWNRNDVVHGQVWSTHATVAGDCTQALPCSFQKFIAENPRSTVIRAKFRIGQNSGTTATDAGEYLVDDVTFGYGNAVNYDLGG
jgi:hypothetical protein